MQALARKSSENRERIMLFVTFEALADSVDVVIEKPRTARRMANRSTAGEIDDTAMAFLRTVKTWLFRQGKQKDVYLANFKNLAVWTKEVERDIS